jgi:microcin C transport system substrate-binding protein
VSYPEDYSSVTFGLRANAKFEDGKPITPEDVIFSLEAQKKANPRVAQFYKNVSRGEKTGPNEVTFHFDVKGNRELPLFVGELTVIPKHFWESRDLAKSTLDTPVGSGPYKIKEVDRGRWITFERVKDWWAKDLPVAVGQYNFDEIRFDYYRERTAAFEQFKAGRIDYWYENTAKAWATEYDFPAVKQGLVKLDKLETKRAMPLQAFAFNTRRPQFQDPRVRQAFNLAFNFEAMNEQLLYSQYIRTSSYFVNSELRSTGLPQGAELDILRAVQKEAPEGIPAEVFTTEFKQPVGGPDSQHRRNLAEAAKLLREAGWQAKGSQLRNAQNQTLQVEFLLGSPSFERHVLRYADDLKKLGIDASLRVVDPAQYQRRERAYDFDVIVEVFGQSLSPGNEQRAYWSSQAADHEGGMNVIGVKNKAVDKLVDRVIFVKDRAELIAAAKALDRVLLWNHYIVAQWHYPFDRMAYWDKYSHPAKMPSMNPSFERVWWFDADKAKALAAKMTR